MFRDVKNGRLTVTHQRKVRRGEQFGSECATGTSLQKLRRELREALVTSYVDVESAMRKLKTIEKTGNHKVTRFLLRVEGLGLRLRRRGIRNNDPI